MLADVPRLAELVNYYAAQGRMLRRSEEEVHSLIRDFAVVEDGTVLGCGALHIFAGGLGEIRSLVVDAEHWGKGYGRALVEHLLEEARALGLKQVFALTYEIAFFQKMGFSVVPKESLPQKIWTDCINCPKFPSCDETAMIRDV